MKAVSIYTLFMRKIYVLSSLTIILLACGRFGKKHDHDYRFPKLKLSL